MFKTGNRSKFFLFNVVLGAIMGFPKLAQGEDSSSDLGVTGSLGVVPAPEISESVRRGPASTQNSASTDPRSGSSDSSSRGSKVLRDESELQVQSQLFKPDRKTSRERKPVNFDGPNEEE